MTWDFIWHSGSRLVSNGCHWLDYFLFMNSFAEVAEAQVTPLRDRDLAVTVRLANNASFVMSLTDTGSSRLGVRDVIELRARDVTVRMIDGNHYHAENSRRILRRKRVNPMDAYRQMYRTICKRIVAGQAGDPPESLRSTELMLRLEDEVKRWQQGEGSV